MTEKSNARENVDKRWFQNLFSDKRIAQAQLAKAIGIHGPALTRMLNGERRLQMGEAIDMARILEIPLEEIMVHAGLSPASGTPVAVVRGTIDERNVVIPSSGRETTPAPQEGLSALENPRLKWVLFYKQSANVSPDAVGRLAMITAGRNEEPRIMFVERGSRAGFYDLKDPSTMKLTKDVALTSASPVLFIRT